MRRALLLGLLVAAAAAAAHAPAAPPLPAPDAPLPREPKRLAHELLVTTRAVHRAVDRWLAEGDPAAAPPPREVELLALRHQRIYRLLRRDDALARRVYALLPSGLAREARTLVGAGRGLRRITPALEARKIRTKRPLPIGVLLRHYREAERRFGVPWHVLAAVNLVESLFGKIRTDSAAGAQGPMQFMPGTWAQYGEGDIDDPRDAIRAAARYLRASGAPGEIDRALFAYNRSEAYVQAIRTYADLMRADPRLYRGYYSWQVFYRHVDGDRLLPVGYDGTTG